MLESQIIILKLNVDWVSKSITNDYYKLQEQKQKSTYNQYLHINITLSF